MSLFLFVRKYKLQTRKRRCQSGLGRTGGCADFCAGCQLFLCLSAQYRKMSGLNTVFFLSDTLISGCSQRLFFVTAPSVETMKVNLCSLEQKRSAWRAINSADWWTASTLQFSMWVKLLYWHSPLAIVWGSNWEKMRLPFDLIQILLYWATFDWLRNTSVSPCRTPLTYY